MVETRETHRLAAAAALRCPRGGSKIAFKIPIRERKQITVLFADLKGSTELIRDLDSEQAQAILDPALHTMKMFQIC